MKSKLKLFSNLSNDGVAIVNIDDVSFEYIKDLDKNTITYGVNKKADYMIKNISLFDDKTLFELRYKNKTYNVESPLLGKFNVYNLTLAIACCCSFVIDICEIIEFVKDIKPISGRLNVFKCKNGAKVILDYAHTINATEEILSFANEVKSERIITVLGCAGGRDKKKRESIGRIATELSDKVIFTMDDPRYEKVKNIIEDMVKGVKIKNYISIVNRKRAIRYAINSAKKNDLVLILGKGTDNYMAIRNKYKSYSDLKVIKKYI